MRSTAMCWILAVIVTLASAAWQRRTGPTYPVSGTVTLAGQQIAMTLDRSHSTASDQSVRVAVANPEVTGEVAWRRFPSADRWTTVAMRREGGELTMVLPRQPAAGKLEYQVRLQRGAAQAVFPPRPAVIRFKGDVPAVVLAPHILAMFLGMLFAARAGFEAVFGRPRLAPHAWVATLLIGVGGFALGPAVQKFAFDAWWTGVPFGWDLTDNKTLIAGAAWLVALAALRTGRWARATVLAASLITLVVFAIPHSAWGSEIKWDRLPASAVSSSLAP